MFGKRTGTAAPTPSSAAPLEKKEATPIAVEPKDILVFEKTPQSPYIGETQI